MDAQNAVKICQEQERLLRFHTFTNAQAWELGSAMVGQLRARKLPLCVAVWSLSGYVLFQYAPQGTTLNNQNWMRRKFNTVRLMEKSSLAARAAAELSGEGVEQAGLDPREYVFCGGGFPIRLKSGELVAVALASGLPDTEDHAFLVEALGRYLGVEAPQVR